MRRIALALAFLAALSPVKATTPTEAQNAVDAATASNAPTITKTILNSVLTSIVSAISTVYSSPVFTGAISGPSISIGGTGTGVLTEFGQLSSVQTTSVTGQSLWSQVIDTSNYKFYDAFNSVLDIEPGSTVQHGAAVSAYVKNNVSQGVNPNQKNGVGFFSLGVNYANDAYTWNINTACNDNISPNTFVTTCLGWEADFTCVAACKLQGIGLIFTGAVAPTAADGIQIAKISTGKWVNGLITGDDAISNAAMIVGLSGGTGGASYGSQPIFFNTTGTAPFTGHYAAMKGIPNGASQVGVQFYNASDATSSGLAMLTSVAGGQPALISAGTSANINLGLTPQGTGAVVMNSGQANGNGISFIMAASTLHPTIQASGTDANVNLNLAPKGSGGVIVTAGSLAAPGLSISGGNLIATAIIQGGAVAVASLPTCNGAAVASRYFVTDATQTLTAGIGAVVAGGGGNKVPVICDTANWRIGG